MKSDGIFEEPSVALKESLAVSFQNKKGELKVRYFTTSVIVELSGVSTWLPGQLYSSTFTVSNTLTQ